jgi:hypothetical protein
LEILKASKFLRPSKFIGLHAVPGFAIKGCSEILVPVHK